MEQDTKSGKIQGSPDDPITREIKRISNLSSGRLISEVVQMATNWLVEHGTDLSISGWQVIAKAYRARLVESTKQGEILT
jgi:hypothetical protein